MQIFVPPELKNEEADIKRFFDAMIFKLRKNADKRGFDTATVTGCVDRMNEEIDELTAAISEGNDLEIILEAADVANFALLIAGAAIRGNK